MANELAMLFNDVLIVPIDEELANGLEELYDDVVGHEDFDIDACIKSIVQGEDCGSEDILRQLYEEKNGVALKLPSVCYHLYDQYICYWYICHDDEIDDDSRLAASLSLRNLLTILDGSYCQLASSLYLDECCNYHRQYIKKALLPMKDLKHLDVLGKNSFTQEQKEDENFFWKTKALAVKAAKYDFMLLKQKLALLPSEAPYVKACKIASQLANTEHWEFIVTEPEKIMEGLLEEYKQERMLCTIRREFKDVEEYGQNEPEKFSSVILRYLYDESNEERLGRQKFSPLRFAKHLFYEFLSESC